MLHQLPESPERTYIWEWIYKNIYHYFLVQGFQSCLYWSLGVGINNILATGIKA